jgi:hypothetical protein
VRLLVKNPGRDMPESVVREELESLNIRVEGVTQLRSGRRDQDPAKDRPPTPYFIVSVVRGPEVSKVRLLTELCGLRVSVELYVAPKGPLQCKRCQRFGHTQRNCGYAPQCVACGGSHISGGCSTPLEQPLCCGCGGNHTANYRGCVKWKEAKSALAKQAPDRGCKSAATLPLRRHSGPGPLPSRWTWARGGITKSEGGVLSRLPLFHPLLKNHLSQPVTEALEQPRVTATRKTATPEVCAQNPRSFSAGCWEVQEKSRECQNRGR